MRQIIFMYFQAPPKSTRNILHRFETVYADTKRGTKGQIEVPNSLLFYF